jgi:ABC-type phosphate/phosphonate transport system substrate-binding protein
MDTCERCCGKKLNMRPVIIGLLLLPAIQLAVLGATAIADPHERPPLEMRFASVTNTVTGVNLEDARLAIEMIMKKILIEKYPHYRFKVDFFPDLASATKALAHNSYHSITMTGLDYLSVRRSANLDPLLIASKVDQPVESFLLLTRRGETLETIAQNPRRELIVEQGGSGDMARIWLDVLLRSQNMPESRVFFNMVRQAEKPGRAVLPVFFGQADACVVAESAFAVLKELNPQIGSRLQVLQRSPGFVRVLICATDLMEPRDAGIITKEAVSLDEWPQGQQVLTIIQMKHLFGFEPEYLNATANLFRQYQQMVH